MADCFKMYSDNLVDQAVFTATTTNALFPTSNLKDPRRSKVYRSTTNSDNIILDFQETSDINGIFIMPSKRDGFGISTVTVEFNATSNFTSPAYSISVPLSETLGIGYVSFTTISYRYARIVMTSTLGYCELSKVFIGAEIPLVRSINFGWTTKDDDLSIITKNRYGQVFADVILRQKSYGFAFKNIDKDDLDLINSMLDRVSTNMPFYIKIGDNTMLADYRRASGPVMLDSIPLVTNGAFNKYSLSMAVKELM